MYDVTQKPTTKGCKGCSHIVIKYMVTVCSRYRAPSAFNRVGGDFMCPSSGLIPDSGDQMGKVRAGQQKTKRRNR